MFYKKIIVVLSIFVVLFFIFSFFDKKTDINTVRIKDNVFFVEVASTEIERERGLSLHVPLLDNQGMLFLFGKEDFHSFWMKDMNFAIDIIWINSNHEIVYIEKNISPETYPKIFTPKVKSLYVLEILAGQSDLLKINVGDMVNFSKK